MTATMAPVIHYEAGSVSMPFIIKVAIYLMYTMYKYHHRSTATYFLLNNKHTFLTSIFHNILLLSILTSPYTHLQCHSKITHFYTSYLPYI